MKFKIVSRILKNWAGLDPLKNEACFHAFEIKNKLQVTFKTHLDNEKKLEKDRQGIIKQIQEDVQELKKAGAESVKNTKIEKQPGGGIKMNDIPPDVTEQYQEEIEGINKDLDNLKEKTKEVEFAPLTYKELAKYDLVKGRVVRMFEEIIDLTSKPEEIEEPKEVGEDETKEVTDGQSNGQKQMKRKES